MNSDSSAERPMSKGEWFWLVTEIAVFEVFLAVSVIFRRFALELLFDERAKVSHLPKLTKILLMTGPFDMSAMLALVLCLAATLLAIPFFLKGKARTRYLFHLPFLGFGIALVYHALLLSAFMIPFVVGMNSPIPSPVLSFGLWISLTALYILILVEIVLRRTRNKT